MHECSIAAHAVCVRTTMLSLCSVLNFLRSRLTREHIASYFQMSLTDLCQSDHKVTKLLWDFND